MIFFQFVNPRIFLLISDAANSVIFVISILLILPTITPPKDANFIIVDVGRTIFTVPGHLQTLQRSCGLSHHPRSRTAQTVPRQPSEEDRQPQRTSVERVQGSQGIARRHQRSQGKSTLAFRIRQRKPRSSQAPGRVSGT